MKSPRRRFWSVRPITSGRRQEHGRTSHLHTAATRLFRQAFAWKRQTPPFCAVRFTGTSVILTGQFLMAIGDGISMSEWPNKASAVDGGIRLLLAIVRAWPATIDSHSW